MGKMKLWDLECVQHGCIGNNGCVLGWWSTYRRLVILDVLVSQAEEDRRPIKDHVARHNTAFVLCFNCLRG